MIQHFSPGKRVTLLNIDKEPCGTGVVAAAWDGTLEQKTVMLLPDQLELRGPFGLTCWSLDYILDDPAFLQITPSARPSL